MGDPGEASLDIMRCCINDYHSIRAGMLLPHFDYFPNCYSIQYIQKTEWAIFELQMDTCSEYTSMGAPK